MNERMNDKRINKLCGFNLATGGLVLAHCKYITIDNQVRTPYMLRMYT